MERDILSDLVFVFVISYVWSFISRSVGYTPSFTEGVTMCVVIAALYILIDYLVRNNKL